MIKHELCRAWDAFDAYLFDIDGTLIHSTDAVHYYAFCQALSSIAGRPLNLEGVTAHGNTDVGILRDAFALAGVEDAVWRPQLREIRESMARFVDGRKNELCTTVLPQVKEMLQHLRARGAALGVATGNLEKIGKIKLASARLFDLFDFYGWSDSFEYRADVFRGAVNEARLHVGSEAAILVIGDTPADVQAARENSLSVIAVATGIYSFEQLQATEPDLCIQSFGNLLTFA
jgi:phosphoglycolate phosphatase-like HAD superfamily hydrolase